MRALVTGLTGFVGGHLAEHLLDGGDEVFGWSSHGTWPTDLTHLSARAGLHRVDLATVGLEELKALVSEVRPKAVYHLAAQASPRLSREDPETTWAVNLEGTRKLLEAVRESARGARLLIVGTGVCYAPADDDGTIREDSPLRPDSPYAESKLAADRSALEEHRKHGLDVIVARPLQHAGPRQRLFALTEWAKRIAEVEVGRKSVVEHGNLDVVRDYTDVRDIVRAYRRLVEDGAAGEVYNVGSGRDLLMRHAFERLIGLARVPVAAFQNPSLLRPDDPPRLVFDITKLRAATGWKPELDILDHTLPDLLDFWRGEAERVPDESR